MRNQYTVTKKEMMTYTKLDYFFFQKKRNLIWFVLWVVDGILCAIAMALMAVVGGTWLSWYFVSLFFALSVYELFFARRIATIVQYKNLCKSIGASEWVFTTEFTDDAIIISDPIGFANLKYGNVKKIREKGNGVMIFMNDGMQIKLYKDAFVEGTWEECKEKIHSIHT